MSASIMIHDFECVLGVLPKVEVVKKRYHTGDLALYIYSEFNGCRETVMIASCLVPGIPPGHVAIKDFSENRGCLLGLVRAGLIDEPDRYSRGIPICRVLF